VHEDEENEQARGDEMHRARRLAPAEEIGEHWAAESTPGDIESPVAIMSGRRTKITAI